MIFLEFLFLGKSLKSTEFYQVKTCIKMLYSIKTIYLKQIIIKKDNFLMQTKMTCGPKYDFVRQIDSYNTPLSAKLFVVNRSYLLRIVVP